MMFLIGFSVIYLKEFIKQNYHRHHWLQRKRIFDHLYLGINGNQISKKARATLKTDIYGLMYGEISFESFASLLTVIQPKPTDVFYDLGSGTGKAVFCSAMLYEWKKCSGIELLPDLYDTSIKQLKKLNASPEAKRYFVKLPLPIQFTQGDFLEVDFSDATVIFINATSFTAEFWQLIINKLDTLPIGVRIIVTSKKLTPPCYQLLEAKMYLMSWGWNSVYIYQKINK